MDLHNEIHREINDIIGSTVREARNYIEKFTNTRIDEIKKESPYGQEEHLKMMFTAYAYTWKTETKLLGVSIDITHPDQDINIYEKVLLYLKWDDVRYKLNEKNQQELNLLKQKYRI